MQTAIIVPNWNGEDYLKSCLDSLVAQTIRASIIVVDNGSVDGSLKILSEFSDVIVLKQARNLGFAGGVNVGIQYALDKGAEFILLFNNDAVADKKWAEQLVAATQKDKRIGLVSPKFLKMDKVTIDSTGDFYTTYGLPFPRGRDEKDKGQYDACTTVFGVSGGASLYRASMLKDVGLFDKDFFAYFEDVDLSFRAQLRNWKAVFEPRALAYHRVSATSSKLGDFSIYQTAKNFPLLFIRNMPVKLLLKYGYRALYWYIRMFGARIVRGGGLAYTRGFLRSLTLLPKKLIERRTIQKNKLVDNAYIDRIIYHGRPPIARNDD